MIRTERLRAFLLEVGDVFILTGMHYKVIYNDGIVIKYKAVYGKYTNGNIVEMSSNSRRVIELVVTNKTK